LLREQAEIGRRADRDFPAAGKIGRVPQKKRYRRFRAKGFVRTQARAHGGAAGDGGVHGGPGIWIPERRVAAGGEGDAGGPKRFKPVEMRPFGFGDRGAIGVAAFGDEMWLGDDDEVLRRNLCKGILRRDGSVFDAISRNASGFAEGGEREDQFDFGDAMHGNRAVAFMRGADRRDG